MKRYNPTTRPHHASTLSVKSYAGLQCNVAEVKIKNFTITNRKPV
uniref:Uncharacterized protein n=1 Tax=Bacteriophage sp. TaxID=38018 RepID=A0A8D9PEC8_9VIRU|nr:MAG TPA: hypothetical protein [Bacteriophage sp.]